MCDGDSDSGDSGDFAPGPAVTELRLSEELSTAWQVDAGLRERACAVVRAFVNETGDTVRVLAHDGHELVMVFGVRG